MMLQRARAIVPLEYGSHMKLRSSTTTLLMKTVERPFFRKNFTQCTQRRKGFNGCSEAELCEKFLTAAVKLNSALSIFIDMYARRVPFS